MSTATLRGQVERMRRDLGLGSPPEGECDRPEIGLILEADGDGEPVLTDEGNGQRCSRCGGLHALVIREYVVEPDPDKAVLP
jgi:hypothetical protein